MKEWLKIFRMRLRDTVLFFSSLKLSLSHLSARRSSWTTGWPSQRPPRSPPTPPPVPSLPWSAPRLTSPIKAALGMGRARRRDQLKKNNSNVYCISNKTYCFYNLYSICILKNVLKFWFSTIYQIQPKYMTGLLHDVRGNLWSWAGFMAAQLWAINFAKKCELHQYAADNNESICCPKCSFKLIWPYLVSCYLIMPPLMPLRQPVIT